MKYNKSRERLTGDDRKSSVLFNRHLAAYLYAISLIDKKCCILDLGCSDGYGSFLMAKFSKETIALDIDKETIEKAKKEYKVKGLKFITGNALSLSWKGKFDMVVSLQLIEHLNDANLYLEQVKKVLNKNGIFILSTPNRLLRLSKGQKPWNKFHICEYDSKEIEAILKRYFSKVKILGLTAVPDIYLNEKKRLRLRRLISKLDIFDIYEKIPREIIDYLLFKIRGGNKQKKISVRDFFITQNKIDKSLDLIAICRK